VKDGVTGPRNYELISADGHIMEPGDLWVRESPAKYRDLVPRLEHLEEGDAWVTPGQGPGFGFVMIACAGRAPDQMSGWCRLDEVNPGVYDPKARVQELDLDGVDAEVLFPNGLDWVVDSTDREFQLTMTRIYNDHLVSFCQFAPERFGGCALVPPYSVEDAVAEVHRLADTEGIVGFLLKRYPTAKGSLSPEDEPLWAAIAETGKPIAIHVSLTSAASFNLSANPLPGATHFYDAPTRMLEFIFSGVLDRYPDLMVFLAEVDCGWMPYFAQQADDNYSRHAHSMLKDRQLDRMPSDYMRERFPASFITDPYAVANRHYVGVERMLWSSDYPHITTDWPYSWRTINSTFLGVPADERHAILAGNAQRLFGFGR
jgi:predicted TIM-barrel fold metal-dependent hydrolase